MKKRESISNRIIRSARDLITGSIPKRSLGSTGLSVTQLGLGGESILTSKDKETAALNLIREALELGINYFDTAPGYKPSERRLGEALYGSRNDVVIATKTDKRDRTGALKQLDESLKNLRTDYVDIWQVHHIDHHEEVDQIFKSGGAMEALQEALEDGRVRHVGITGHYDTQPILEALRRYEFDTVLMPVNAADIHKNSFIKRVIPAAQSHGIGIVGMKVCSRGRLFDPRHLTNMDQALGYALSHPVSTVIVGCDTVGQLYENVLAAKEGAITDSEYLKKLEAMTKEYEPIANFFKKGNEKHNLFWEPYKPGKRS